MSDQLDAAQAQVDQAWAQHEQYRGPLRDTLRGLVASLEGVTGLGPGPGADRLTDLFLDYAEQHSDEFKNAVGARAVAMAQQEARDEVLANEPAAPVEAQPGLLEQLEDDSVRAWLRGATDSEVRTALSEVPTTDDQRAWATKLMRWGRADGNQAQVFAAINEFLTPTNPADVPEGRPTGGTGATSTYMQQQPPEAAAGDTPIPGGQDSGPSATPPDGDEVLDWLDETQGPAAEEPATQPEPAPAEPAAEPAPADDAPPVDIPPQPAPDAPPTEAVVDQPADG